MGRVQGGKWRQLCLNNNKEKEKKMLESLCYFYNDHEKKYITLNTEMRLTQCINRNQGFRKC